MSTVRVRAVKCACGSCVCMAGLVVDARVMSSYGSFSATSRSPRDSPVVAAHHSNGGSPRERRSPRRGVACSPKHVSRRSVPLVPFEKPLAAQIAALPLIYTAPSSSKASGGIHSTPVVVKPRLSHPAASRSTLSVSSIRELLRTEPTEEHLVKCLEYNRRVPHMKRKPPRVPPPRIRRVINITMHSADIVIEGRVGSMPPKDGQAVRLMLSLDGGSTFREQAVAAVDVFHVGGLLPGKHYVAYVADAADSVVPHKNSTNSNTSGQRESLRATLVRFATHNMPVDPRTNKPAVS